jgi:hypothetical protein
MSITGVTQYADGLGECSALAAMQTLGVTTGRISNDAYASLVDMQAVNTFIPSFLSNFCWIYVQVRVTSSNPLVLGEYIDLRASFMGYDLQYPIYPVSGPSPTNYQCGPFLRTFRFGRVDSIAPIAVVYAGISSSIARSLEIRSVFVQTL